MADTFLALPLLYFFQSYSCRYQLLPTESLGPTFVMVGKEGRGSRTGDWLSVVKVVISICRTQWFLPTAIALNTFGKLEMRPWGICRTLEAVGFWEKVRSFLRVDKTWPYRPLFFTRLESILAKYICMGRCLIKYYICLPSSFSLQVVFDWSPRNYSPKGNWGNSWFWNHVNVCTHSLEIPRRPMQFCSKGIRPTWLDKGRTSSETSVHSRAM